MSEKKINSDPHLGAIDWSDLSSLWTEARRKDAADTLRDWCLQQTDARAALQAITESSPRVGVWLACAVARSVLSHIPDGEDRPRLALEGAERWVRGELSEMQCRDADFAYQAHEYASAVYATDHVAYKAAHAAGYAAQIDSTSAAYAAAAYAADIRPDTFGESLSDLCKVIAREVRPAIDAAALGSQKSMTTTAQTTPTLLSLDWSDIPSWTVEHRDAVASALRNWCLEQTDARAAIRTIAESSRVAGVWLACVVARSALIHVPKNEHRPHVSIETAERWARGRATAAECLSAADAAEWSCLKVGYTANDAARAAATAARAVATQPECSPGAAVNVVELTAIASAQAAAYAAADAAMANRMRTTHEYSAAYSAAYRPAHDKALRDLCGVLAQHAQAALIEAWLGFAKDR